MLSILVEHILVKSHSVVEKMNRLMDTLVEEQLQAFSYILTLKSVGFLECYGGWCLSCLGGKVNWKRIELIHT